MIIWHPRSIHKVPPPPPPPPPPPLPPSPPSCFILSSSILHPAAPPHPPRIPGFGPSPRGSRRWTVRRTGTGGGASGACWAAPSPSTTPSIRYPLRPNEIYRTFTLKRLPGGTVAIGGVKYQVPSRSPLRQDEIYRRFTPLLPAHTKNYRRYKVTLPVFPSIDIDAVPRRHLSVALRQVTAAPEAGAGRPASDCLRRYLLHRVQGYLDHKKTPTP